MIAVDTSSLIAYLGGDAGDDVDALDQALEAKQIALPPVVLTEILSDPRLDRRVADHLLELPRLETGEGYWERAAALRASVLSRRLRARLADTLISQSCIDHGTPLIARDADFRHFAEYGDLRLV